MSPENYGSIWEIDHRYQISQTNLFNKSDKFKSTYWFDLRPMYCNENNSKKAKNDHRLYLLKETSEKYFLEIN